MESCNLKSQMTNKEAVELKRIIKNKMWGMSRDGNFWVRVRV